MSEMVERVARSLCCGNPDEKMRWFGGKVGKLYRNWETCVPQARAAIEAMREPTAEMLNKGIDCLLDDIKIQWQAMIDEALK